MAVLNRVAELQDEMKAWRHRLHSHPETAFEEFRTAELVATSLSKWRIDVCRGIGGTGVVGILRSGHSARTLGLRADMDALDLQERNDCAHRSMLPNKMHACGHDGHTAMLLGAARCLAERRNFDGTIYFIFQPAEENWGGGEAMVRDGLFDRFPMDRVFGLHNMPGLAVGRFAFRHGQMSAEAHKFVIDVTGVGTHSADPGSGVDPIQVATDIIHAFRSVPEAIAPKGTVIPRVTEIHGGLTLNVVPESVRMRGTTRILHPEHREPVRQWMSEVVGRAADAAGATAQIDFPRFYPIVINTKGALDLALAAASDVMGEGMTEEMAEIDMSGEDFSFLAARCGEAAYLYVGNGTEGPQVHNPRYDFNDELLPIGASYWVRLAELALPRDEALVGSPLIPLTAATA